MQREATAAWHGKPMRGSGTVSTESKILLSTPYSFQSRFENGSGTNPEELLAAAHAACFSMALSHELGALSIDRQELQTTARVSIELFENKWTIRKVHLKLQAQVPEVSQEDFRAAVERAKTNCPVSRLFNADISLEFELESARKSA